MTRRVFQVVVVLMILFSLFGSAGSASAWSGCASYITVQWGDTLSGIAVQCGTTVNAIRAANPGLGWWVYAGQVLYIPTGSSYEPAPQPTTGGTYTVKWGDTLGKIAARSGTSVSSILAVNPQIWNASLIYAGQVINLPSGIVVPNPPPYTPPTQPPQNCPCDDPGTGNGSLSTLTIDYKHGMLIRTAPNGTVISGALNNDVLYYRTNSTYTDSKWRVWVEVRLFPPVKGYTTGWMLVKDQFGTYFTDPQID